MERFDFGQLTHKVGGINVGGQPGEYPVVMIGTMFHPGHRLVDDPRRGAFDREEARSQLEAGRELGRDLGLPRMTQVIGETVGALTKYVEFVAEVTTDPIVVESPAREVRVEVADEYVGTPLAARLLFCPVTEASEPDELERAGQLGGAMVVASSADRRRRPADRLSMLRDHILPKTREAGIERVLVDAGVADFASLGWTVQAMRQVKAQTGLPAGCAPMTAFSAWRRAARVRPPAADSAAGAALALPVYFGADFVFYGAINHAPWAYPVCAAAAAVVAYAGRNVGIRPATRHHPLFQLF